MNRMLFLICLWLAFLGGLEGRAWGMALPGRDASIHAYEGRDVVERGLGAVPSEDAASVARGRMTGHDYDTGKLRGFSGEVGCLERMQDGPNLYAYVKQNPWTSFDPEGLWLEDIALGVPSIGVGAHSMWNNIKKGHVGSAIWDGVGIVLDGAAIATPGVPGGVGLATKAARLAAAKSKVENTINTVETVVDVGAAVATGDPTALVEVIVDEALDKATGGKKKGGESPTRSQRPPNPDGPKGN